MRTLKKVSEIISSVISKYLGIMKEKRRKCIKLGKKLTLEEIERSIEEVFFRK